MKVWDGASTAMFSIGVSFGLMMVVAGLHYDSFQIWGSGIGLILGTLLVSYLSIRQIQKLNKVLGLK